MDRATRQQQTRTRLLDAPAEVFARLGFHAATVDDVAEAAGYTKGTVYSNFATKDALFVALLDRHLDTQFDQVDALFDTDGRSWAEGRLTCSCTASSPGGCREDSSPLFPTTSNPPIA